MIIFQYNLYMFGIHLWTVLYPKLCYNEPCYKEVVVYNSAPACCGPPLRGIFVTTPLRSVFDKVLLHVCSRLVLFTPYLVPQECYVQCHIYFLTLVLLNPDIPCLCKQCRSRSVGFWRSQLIWICTVWH